MKRVYEYEGGGSVRYASGGLVIVEEHGAEARVVVRRMLHGGGPNSPWEVASDAMVPVACLPDILEGRKLVKEES